MKDFEILASLQTAVAAAVEASGKLPATAVKYVGRVFTPPNDQKYLEVVFIPNNRVGGYLADSEDFAGMLRLVLHWPIDDAGAIVPGETLAAICAYFTKGLLIDGVQIVTPANSMGVLEGNTENLYPASIRYTSHRH